MIYLHLPDTEQESEDLQHKVAVGHARAVADYIRNMTCTLEQKQEILNAVLGSVKQQV